ncbi:MAG: hypothetical protein ING21_10195 [Burkholderiales bacterium]|nr:hypothetical protein [Burkholderiales bacterium]
MTRDPMTRSHFAIALTCLILGIVIGRFVPAEFSYSPNESTALPKAAIQVSPAVPSNQSVDRQESSASFAATAIHNSSLPAQSPRASLDPSSVRLTALKVVNSDVFVKQQIAVTNVNCIQDGTCRVDLQIPPFSPAAVAHDASVGAELLAEIRSLPEYQGMDVGLTHISFGKEGVSVGISVGNGAKNSGRYYTASEIAKIRLDTIEDYVKQQGVKR